MKKSFLNTDVVFCKKCVESNQRFVSSIQHLDNSKSHKSRTNFNDDNICNACLYFEKKSKIDWEKREKELIKICDKYRKNDGNYDVLIPGSGGKDSVWVSHIMKHKFKMNPLTVTWAPHMYTEIGWKNFQNWVHSGFDNYLFTPNPTIHRKLTRLAFENLLHPFQPFAMGQTYFPVKIAVERNINLIMYGDAQAEKAGDGDLWNEGASINPSLFTYENKDKLFFGGVKYRDIKKMGISDLDLNPYLPLEKKVLEKFEITPLVLPYYINQNPQDNFYFAVEKSNFTPNSKRTDGSYTKYSSIDDKIDDLHHYTWFIKTGRGRCTEDAALEIRNNIINRDEAISLVKQYDGEFPKTYFKDILEYLGIDEKKFHEIIDKFRPEHLWKKENKKWVLKKAVWKNLDE